LRGFWCVRARTLLLVLLAAAPASALEPIPDKLVVLTFDDAVKSHYTVVRPILLKHRFGATFFVTEGFDFKTNKQDYLTWDEIAQLERDGFEIGNHTRDHLSVTAKSVDKLAEQIEGIAARCREHGIPVPTSFAYPGNSIEPAALPILKRAGIVFARRGGAPEHPYKLGRGVAYEPGLDHPLLVPSAGDARPAWTLDDFQRAASQARAGRIAVLQFHGVPDRAHDWVNTPVERFEQYMHYLATHGYRAIAMRDLARYVDAKVEPQDPLGAVRDRQARLAAGKPLVEFRRPRDDFDLRAWLENMAWHHRYSVPEIEAATGLTPEEIAAAVARWDIREGTRPKRAADAPLLVLPYPGGRHPRTGFLDGAIRPQRETKLSVFLPWDESAYVVLDVPEAIRRNDEARQGLLYLAHSHVPTMWTRQGVDLPPLEWERTAEGRYRIERRLPNGVSFGLEAAPGKDGLRMELWLTNGSTEPLSNLRVQNCLMLKAAPEFADPAAQRVLARPYAACRSVRGDRWVITAWERCAAAWANPPCPCLHSDPQFPDCAPGQTQRLRGWLSFYQGSDIQAEFRRLDAAGWK
jgi:peptidoglycan/xylan/chitin deacetylase (PgdA/CDA1 family)